MVKEIEKLTGRSYKPDHLVLKHNSVAETYPIHTHDFYEYFLVTNGRALHVVNSTTHLIERGTLVLIRPRDVHYYDFYNSNNFEFYNVGMSIKHFEHINSFFHGALNPIEICDVPKHVMLDDTHTDVLERQLLEINQESVKGWDIPLFSLVAADVCYTILTGVEKEPQAYMPDWLFHLRKEMEMQENFVGGLTRLLELSNYSQEYVNRMFKRYMNITPTHFINEKRLVYAKDLLNNTNLPVSVICEQCGFRNLSYFYEQYKARFGRTPGKEASRNKMR